MKKITINNIDGSRIQVDLMTILNLTELNKKFIIFSKGETYKEGMNIVYLSEITEVVPGNYNLVGINDDVWGNVRDAIKVIVQGNNTEPLANIELDNSTLVASKPIGVKLSDFDMIVKDGERINAVNNTEEIVLNDNSFNNANTYTTPFAQEAIVKPEVSKDNEKNNENVLESNTNIFMPEAPTYTQNNDSTTNTYDQFVTNNEPVENNINNIVNDNNKQSFVNNSPLNSALNQQETFVPQQPSTNKELHNDFEKTALTAQVATLASQVEVLAAQVGALSNQINNMLRQLSMNSQQNDYNSNNDYKNVFNQAA